VLPRRDKNKGERIMLQYDLTATRLLNCTARHQLPTEAELFVITVALLLVREVAYGDFSRNEISFLAQDLSAVVECIEYRLLPLAPDMGAGDRRHQRICDFVGLRIGAIGNWNIEQSGDQES